MIIGVILNRSIPCVVMHLFDSSLTRSVFEKWTDGAGRDVLRLTRFETALGEHTTSIGRLDTAIGSIRPHLNLPAPAVNATNLEIEATIDSRAWMTLHVVGLCQLYVLGFLRLRPG